MNAPPTKREKLLRRLHEGVAVDPPAVIEVIDGYESDLAVYATRPTVAEWQDKLREVEELRAQLAAAEAKLMPLERHFEITVRPDHVDACTTVYPGCSPDCPAKAWDDELEAEASSP
jgi:hypothetical protein